MRFASPGCAGRSFVDHYAGDLPWIAALDASLEKEKILILLVADREIQATGGNPE